MPRPPILLLLVTMAFGSQARAQTSPEHLDEAARLTFESAREAYVAGDYETALARFRQAYQLSPRPGLLYNIAQTLDRLRRDEETVQALRDYLRASPDAQNRAEVESRIRVIEQALAQRRPAPTEEPQSTEAPTSGGGGLHPAFFLAASGLALGGAGVLVWAGLETMALNDAYLASTSYESALDLYGRAESQQLLTNVFLGVTAGLGAAAIVLVIFTDWSVFTGGSASAAARPLFYAGPGGAWLGLAADF